MTECTNGEMRDLLPELVSGRLGAEMQLAVEAHVAECEECAGELALLRALRPALMRTPAIDTARIAAAVRAQASAPAQRAPARGAMPWRLAMAAAALIAVSVAGYLFAVRGREAAPEIAVVHTPEVRVPNSAEPAVAPSAAPVPKVPVPEERVAVVPKATPNTPAVAASAGVLDNVADLSDDDVRALTASLDGMSAVPSAEPASGIDPLGAALDEQSAGGLR